MPFSCSFNWYLTRVSQTFYCFCDIFWSVKTSFLRYWLLKFSSHFIHVLTFVFIWLEWNFHIWLCILCGGGEGHDEVLGTGSGKTDGGGMKVQIQYTKMHLYKPFHIVLIHNFVSFKHHRYLQAYLCRQKNLEHYDNSLALTSDAIALHKKLEITLHFSI